KNAFHKKDVHVRPESEWRYAQVPHLRIVDDALYERVHARRATAEERAVRLRGSGRLCGRPPKHAVQNTLSGVATCGVCGGALVVEWSQNRKGRYAYYACHTRRHSYKNISCTNAVRIRVEDLTEAVLQAVEAHALTPEAVEQVIQLAERDDARERADLL